MLLDGSDLKMLEENPKEFLDQLRAVYQTAQAEADRISKYRTAAYSTAAKPSSGGGFTMGRAESKIEICAVRINELELELDKKRNKMTLLKWKILFVLDNFVEDELNKDIIYQRFVCLKSWPEVSDKLKLSKRAIFKRQEKFLKEISEKVCTFTSKRDNI